MSKLPIFDLSLSVVIFKRKLKFVFFKPKLELKFSIESLPSNGDLGRGENEEGCAKLLECLSHCVQMVDRIGQVG